MRTIGMLGGMSWESTTEYYRLANQLVRDRRGGLRSAPLLLHSVDFAEVAEMQRRGQWDDAGHYLAERAVGLETAGADVIVLCTNTMHIVADRIEAAVTVPFLHIVDVTAEAVRAAGLTRVGLLGTAFTMEQDFYADRMAERGVELVVPDADDRATVHRVIFDELVLGVLSEESRSAYLDVVARLADRGAQGVVLGCTEIELLLSPDDCPLPAFPTTRLHVEAAVAHALADDEVVAANG